MRMTRFCGVLCLPLVASCQVLLPYSGSRDAGRGGDRNNVPCCDRSSPGDRSSSGDHLLALCTSAFTSSSLVKFQVCQARSGSCVLYTAARCTSCATCQTSDAGGCSSSMREAGTCTCRTACDYVCRSLGRTCRGAWEESDSDNCRSATDFGIPCAETHEDKICECTL